MKKAGQNGQVRSERSGSNRPEAIDASVDVAGVGTVDINAGGAVTAKISGAGDISLHRRPKVLSTSISGFGSIDHDYPGGE